MAKKTDNKNQDQEEKNLKEGILSERHEDFIRAYLLDKNGVKAYQKIYPDSSYDAARTSSSRLLANDNIKKRIEELTADLEKLAGITRFKVLNEFKKLGFSSMANLQKDWLTKKEYDDLTEEELACISEIKNETIEGEGWTKEVIKIKLHDKQRALENINKMLGYNDQTEITQDLNIKINIVKPE